MSAPYTAVMNAASHTGQPNKQTNKLTNKHTQKKSIAQSTTHFTYPGSDRKRSISAKFPEAPWPTGASTVLAPRGEKPSIQPSNSTTSTCAPCSDRVRLG